MQKRESFLYNRLKSIGYAYKGAIYLLKSEASIKIQFAITFCVTIAGIYYKISTLEWCLQILSIGLVMGIEGLNTAVEKLSDFIHPEHHNKIGIIKDVAAGAVFIASIAAIMVGVFIYWPKIF